MRELDLYSGPDACRAAGITYRQLDYWCRRQLVEPEIPATGSGSQRGYTIDQIVDLTIVADITGWVHGSLELARALLDGGRFENGSLTVVANRTAARARVEDNIARLRIRPVTREVELLDPQVAAGRKSLPRQYARMAVSS